MRYRIEHKPADDAEFIRWRLKWLNMEAGELSDSERDLLISFEEQFERNGTLSKRQMEVLESIYKRRA